MCVVRISFSLKSMSPQRNRHFRRLRLCHFPQLSSLLPFSLSLLWFLRLSLRPSFSFPPSSLLLSFSPPLSSPPPLPPHFHSSQSVLLPIYYRSLLLSPHTPLLQSPPQTDTSPSPLWPLSLLPGYYETRGFPFGPWFDSGSGSETRNGAPFSFHYLVHQIHILVPLIAIHPLARTRYHSVLSLIPIFSVV
uniref:Uncharacterized protein n=1 Tax=Cacopsylla melanoneura TaxID=428564 RepID=A0A8D9FBP0_9HEMI